MERRRVRPIAWLILLTRGLVPGLVLGVALTCTPSQGVAADELEVAQLERTAPVDFVVDILPFLRKNCIACHNESEAKGDVVLETVAAILAGIDGDAMVEPGNGMESILFQVAAHRARPPMPPKRNKVGAKALSPQELALLKLWIDQGAKESESGPGQEAEWYKQPQGIQPIYCAAVTEDARFAVCGRANRLTVYPLFAAGSSSILSDPVVADSELYRGAPAAHLDNVQAVAFRPDGEMLASGGYRNVKLWEREDFASSVAAKLPTGAELTVLVHSAHGILAAGTLSGDVMVWKSGYSGSMERSRVDEGAVTALAVGPEGQVIAASKSGRLAVVFDGRVSSTEGGAPVLALAIVGKGSDRVVSGHQDGQLRLWSLSKSELKALPYPGKTAAPEETAASAQVADPEKKTGDPEPESSAVTALVALTGAEDQVVAGSEDGALRILNLTDGKNLREWSHGAAVTALAARADGRVASAGADRLVRLWDIKVEGDKPAETIASVGNSEDERLYVRQKRLVGLFRLRLDDAKKAVEAGRKEVEEKSKALDTATKAVTDKEKALADRQKEAKEAQGTFDEAQAAVAGLEKRVEELKGKKPAEGASPQKEGTAKPSTPEKGATAGDAPKKDDALAEAEKALEAATKTRDELANKSKEAGKKATAAENQLKTARENKEGADENLGRARKTLAEAKEQPAKRQADLGAGEELLAKRAAATAGQAGVVSALTFSPDGGMVAGAVKGQGVRLWNAESGEVMATLPASSRTVAFLANNEVVAQTDTGQTDTGRLTTWSLNPRWKLVRTLGATTGPSDFADRVTALRFSPDGRILLAASGEPSRDGEFIAWSTDDWSVAWKAEHAHSDAIFALDYTLDGKHIASCGADKVVRVWDAADGAAVKAFEGHTSHVLGVSWRFDSKVLASCGADNVIKIWDFESGRQLRTIGGFKKQVTALRFIGDLSQVIACSGDKIVRLHNADDGKAIRDFEGVVDYMYTLDVTTGGNVVASGGFDGALRLWNVKTAAVLGVLAPSVTRRF